MYFSSHRFPFLEKFKSIGKTILSTPITHLHKKKDFLERGERGTINHHLKNFHHIIFSWLLASLVGIYSFLSTSFILDTYAATISPLPPQVTILRGLVSTGSVFLAWNPVSSSSSFPRVTDYVIVYKLSTKTSYKTFIDGVGTGVYARVGPLSSGNTYDFRVRAKNKNGLGPYSTKLRITLPKNAGITNRASPVSGGTTLSTGSTSGSGNTVTPVLNPTPVNGACGTSHGQTISFLPTDLCTTGTASLITSASFSYTWTCAGTDGGKTASCGAYIISNNTYSWVTGAYGSCSLECGGGTQNRTVTCVRNDGAIVADSFCKDAKPSASQSCNTDACIIPMNGACGVFHGQTLTTTPPLTPTTNFCSTGTPSAIASGTSSYTWTCAGTNGGTTANCSASK